MKQTPKEPADTSVAVDDKRLDRLFEYTKFHIGIYLSAGGGLVALLGSAPDVRFIKSLIGSPKALALALLFMVIAGMAGGLVASCSTQYRSFEELWFERQGPHTSKLLKGQTWVLIEHGAFWISVLLLAYAVLSAPAVWSWLEL